MAQFIDRRESSKNKSAVNRQRFIRRFKEQIKQAVIKAAHQRNVTNIDQGEKISLPIKAIHEPHFRHGQAGRWNWVQSGNKEFTVGDRIKRADGQGGQVEQASNSGSGWDEFSFEISREEFLEIFFEDLALPNLIKKQLTALPTYKIVRAGYMKYGSQTNISIIRSLRSANARRIALSGTYKREIKQAEYQLAQLLEHASEDSPDVIKLRHRINNLSNNARKIPFIDPVDVRYHNRIKIPLPTTQAVMFCLMDVSGSMDETKKELAKRFFTLLYLFLIHNYEKIDLVFVRHHTIAKEVDEQEFFYSRETGGTVVSSALELTRDIIQQRFSPDDWNIYIAQASDGDNWSADSPYCQEILTKQILPLVQYYAYVEIMPRYHQSLWEAYLAVKEQYQQFALQTIHGPADIYPVLHELFKRQVAA